MDVEGGGVRDVENLTSDLEGSTDVEKPTDTTDTTNTTDGSHTVFWEEPIDQDPDNPQNWPSSRKWGIIGLLSFLTFLTYGLCYTSCTQ